MDDLYSLRVKIEDLKRKIARHKRYEEQLKQSREVDKIGYYSPLRKLEKELKEAKQKYARLAGVEYEEVERDIGLSPGTGEPAETTKEKSEPTESPQAAKAKAAQKPPAPRFERKADRISRRAKKEQERAKARKTLGNIILLLVFALIVIVGIMILKTR